MQLPPSTSNCANVKQREDRAQGVRSCYLSITFGLAMAPQGCPSTAKAGEESLLL